MKNLTTLLLFVVAVGLCSGCHPKKEEKNMRKNMTASEILGNAHYLAISYGGYREKTRDIQPTLPQLKEDMRLLYAMGIRLIRTYNVHYEEVSNLLQAITELTEEQPSFEMYLMLGAWIDCKNAWTDHPERIRDQDGIRNAGEVSRAVELAKKFPDIVKVIAVGNEAMVHWAQEYYVEPGIILKWVNHLQGLKASGELPADLWITSSDNFASWGGGGSEYHVDDLNQLIAAVDFISMHTYPMHDTHYNPSFWWVGEDEASLPAELQIDAAMLRATDYAKGQYQSVVKYMRSLGIDKPVHIGETGWASISNEHYGKEGSRATDEYKAARYHQYMRQWTKQEGISCFYFEAFDEQWKDAANPMGSENHFGLINLKGEAKYALWEKVDEGVFDGLTRDGQPITKTFNGDFNALMEEVELPPINKQASLH